MRVTDLHIDGFGVWTELRLADLSDRVTVVYGANEAGKTTLMQFMRTVFYGFSPERRGRYLPPVHGGQAGGTMLVDTNRQSLLIERHLHQYRTDAEREQLEVRVRDGASLSPALLDQLLTGVDEPIFNNVFAVGLRELQELGTLDDTDAAELLYKLTTGLDRVSLVDVMRDLDSESRRLLDPRDPASQLLDLQSRREHLQRRVQELSQSGLHWLELEARRVRIKEDAQTLQGRIDELARTRLVVEAAMETHELWSQRNRLGHELEQLGAVVEIPPSALQTLDELGQAIDERQRNVELLKRRRREIHREVAMLPVNELLWSQTARIEALAELAPWIGSIQSQVDQLRSESMALEARLAGSSGKLALDPELVTSDLPDVSSRILSSLRAPAKAVRDETHRLKQVQEEHDTAREQYDAMVAELETALLDQGQENLATAVEQAGSRVARLRRRLQLQQRHDEMSHQRDTLQRDHGELLEDQVLSLTTLAWLGVPFVVGVMLVLGGLIWSHVAALGWPVAILGLAGWIVAVVAKTSLERSAARELDQCEKQLELLGTQLAQGQQEMETLDAELPRSSSSLEARLAAAEQELAGLEELLPLEANLQIARQRAQTAQRRLEQLTATVKEVRAAWREALRRVHLPETLSPQSVRQLAEGNAHSLQTRRQLASRREELAARQQEMAALTARIEEIALHVELNYTVSDPHLLLQRLSAAAAEQRTLHERRQNLRQEDRKVKREGQNVVAQLRKSKAQRRSILARAGVKSEDELRALVARCAHRQTLHEQLADVADQLKRAVPSRLPFEVVERELLDHSPQELQQRCTLLQGQIHEQQKHLAQLHQQQGAVDQEVKTLLADRRLDEARLELGCVQQRLQQVVNRWRVLAVTAHLLENVREIYETQRQPQTLKDASRYFQQLTDGQYVRIWTPLSDMSLRVDMATGESLPLDVLSCGTREAVFLSLRLALVDDFARRGVVLPLVLDDVLVNFDHQRARAAAQVLCTFAQQDHQVLMFTCHDHIVHLFKSLRVPIRRLPHHGQVGQVLSVEPASAAPPQRAPRPVPSRIPAARLRTETEEDIDYQLQDEEEIVEQEDDHYLLDDEGEDDSREPEEEISEDDQDEQTVDEYPRVEATEADEVECEESEDQEQAEEPDEEQEHEQEQLVVEVKVEQKQARGQRFAWESPERWWDRPHNGGAAA